MTEQPQAAVGPELRRVIRRRGMPALLSAITLSSYGFIVGQLALSWAVEASTGSTLAVGLIFAARMVPQLLLGPLSGALADRFDRRRFLVILNVGSALVPFLLAAAALAFDPPLALFLVASLLSGILDAPRIAASQAMAYSAVEPRDAGVAIAVTHVGAHIAGVAGGFLGGELIGRLGVSAALLSVGLSHVLAAAGFVGVKLDAAKHAGPAPYLGSDPLDPAPHRESPMRAPEAQPGHRVRVLDYPNVRALAVTAITLEVFAFSSVALLPAFADKVFALGASGLGTMFSVRSAGAIIGLLTLPALRRRVGGGMLLIGLAATFGVALIGFGVAGSFLVAMILLGTVGFAGAAIDALIQALLQDSAPLSTGRAMGVWVSAIGFGPIGQVEVGLLAGAAGAPVTQVVNGIAVVAVAVAVLAFSKLALLK